MIFCQIIYCIKNASPRFSWYSLCKLWWEPLNHTIAHNDGTNQVFSLNSCDIVIFFFQVNIVFNLSNLYWSVWSKVITYVYIWEEKEEVFELYGQRSIWVQDKNSSCVPLLHAIFHVLEILGFIQLLKVHNIGSGAGRSSTGGYVA